MTSPSSPADAPRLRILHLPTDVGGNASMLSRHERALGHDSRSLTLEESVFGYPSDLVLWRRGDGILRREWKRWRFLPRLLADFDVVHFNFGSTLLPPRVPGDSEEFRRRRWWSRLLYPVYAEAVEQWDLARLKERGVAVFVTFQGDDARQGDYCQRSFDVSIAHEAEPGYYTPEGDRLKRERIARFDRYADGIHALNPDLLRVLPERASFLPYTAVDLDEWRPTPSATDRPLTVVHAPTHRGAKGTRRILAAARRLREREGLPFEFRLVEGRTRAEARRVYESADLFVDQLLAGWYGGAAVELMALGKPVICYLRESDLARLPSSMIAELPIIRSGPDQIEAVLRSCIVEGRTRLRERGERSRRFVENWHDPAKIAARLIEEYREALSGSHRKRA